MNYSVNSVNEGIDALATTRVAIRPDGRMASEAFVTSYKVTLRLLWDLCSFVTLYEMHVLEALWPVHPSAEHASH